MMHEKIRPHHLERKAILYVRQSSAHQVLHNRESSTLQYAMRDRLTAIMTLSTALVTLVTLILALLHEGDIFPLAFEVISAFSNTGYSLGMTGSLSQFGRALLIFTMFWGRLGPLTLVVALAQRDRQSLIYYPEERIIIG
jgi:trk system potassium uptake protein TrkH